MNVLRLCPDVLCDRYPKSFVEIEDGDADSGFGNLKIKVPRDWALTEKVSI